MLETKKTQTVIFQEGIVTVYLFFLFASWAHFSVTFFCYTKLLKGKIFPTEKLELAAAGAY